jgi:hypothetical protein
VWHPATLNYMFERLTFQAGLPPIRLHDLRPAEVAGMAPQKRRRVLGGPGAGNSRSPFGLPAQE